MSDDDLTQQFVELGHISPDQIAQWTDVAGLMAIFDAIGRSGLVTMVKVDGERPVAYRPSRPPVHQNPI